jgi:hypothetical protein
VPAQINVSTVWPPGARRAPGALAQAYCTTIVPLMAVPWTTHKYG